MDYPVYKAFETVLILLMEWIFFASKGHWELEEEIRIKRSPPRLTMFYLSLTRVVRMRTLYMYMKYAYMHIITQKVSLLTVLPASACDLTGTGCRGRLERPQ